MAIKFGRDIMLSNGHRDTIEAISIGLFSLAVLGQQLSIDIEHNTLSWNVCTSIIDVTFHRE